MAELARSRLADARDLVGVREGIVEVASASESFLVERYKAPYQVLTTPNTPRIIEE